MTNRDVALLTFKMLGFLFMIVATMPIAAYLVWGGRPGESTASSLAPALFFLLIGVAVWFGAGSLAARIFPATPTNASGVSLRGDALFGLAVSIMATFLVCMALPDIARAITLFWESRSAALGPDEHVWNPTAKAQAVAAVVRLMTGIALLVGRARPFRLVLPLFLGGVFLLAAVPVPNPTLRRTLDGVLRFCVPPIDSP
jgi:hypothetical protein